MITSNLSMQTIAKTARAPWAKHLRHFGLPWAWRLRVGGTIVIGACRDEQSARHQLAEQHARLKRLGAGGQSHDYGYEQGRKVNVTA